LGDLINKLRQIDAAPQASKDSYNSAIDKYAEELSIESFRSALHNTYPKLN
jgi:predicted outer membrane protein